MAIKTEPWFIMVYDLGKWVWVNTYRYIFSGMNIHLPAILGFTRYQGFDTLPNHPHVRRQDSGEWNIMKDYPDRWSPFS